MGDLAETLLDRATDPLGGGIWTPQRWEFLLKVLQFLKKRIEFSIADLRLIQPVVLERMVFDRGP